MSEYRYIYWQKDQAPNEKGDVPAKVHLLVGYSQATVADYRKMAEDLRKTFPQATDEEISCGKVLESSYARGDTIISWNTYLPKGDYPGWKQFEDGRNPEYSW